jgi:hypothetical protein
VTINTGRSGSNPSAALAAGAASARCSPEMARRMGMPTWRAPLRRVAGKCHRDVVAEPGSDTVGQAGLHVGLVDHDGDPSFRAARYMGVQT